MYIQNNRLSSKIAKFEVLEKKARWVTAKMYERIDSGEFEKLSDELLHEVRVKAGKQGGKASTAARRTKAQQRQIKVKKLFEDGVTDAYSIAGRVCANKATIYRDLKALGLRK